MRDYNFNDFTWGYEVEWGDINRNTTIPYELGTWEYAETDIVNIHAPYQYVACDPLGRTPPVGGEINIKPSKYQLTVIDRVRQLHNIFREQGDKPSASCVNHGHAHVFVPGLKDDIEGLKRLTRYIQRNQALTVEKCYGFTDVPGMRGKSYLKYDGGRLMPDYMCDNIVNLATDFDHYIFLHAAGKDGVSRGRPFRYAINTYCMKHTGTIEFRCFRSTTKMEQVVDSIYFMGKFVENALNGGDDVGKILANDRYEFPPFVYDHQEYCGWETTKYDKSRGKKVRQYYEAT